jgi:hypothetical protein
MKLLVFACLIIAALVVHAKKGMRSGPKKYLSDGKNRVRLELPPEETLVDATMNKASVGMSKVFKMTRGFGKGTVDLLAGKHVYLDQILGKWRLMQDVEVRKGAYVSCPATIELCDGGEVRSYFEDAECVTSFTFRERAWPKYCTISFEAEAFQGPQDEAPVRMFYRGRFKKSILNPNMIFIRGRMYRVSRNVFGTKKKTFVGKFKMTQTRYATSSKRRATTRARGSSKGTRAGNGTGGRARGQATRARSRPRPKSKSKSKSTSKSTNN